MASQIIGRDEELAGVDRFLERAAASTSALVLEGEPGIGKTTIWREAVERARHAGLTELACRPAEAEAKLAFSSLTDLFEPVADEWLALLPEPQKLALGVALLRASPGRRAPDSRAVATAVRSVLGQLAASAPVIVAVDDAQWLDSASARALAFALRRLDGAPVGLLVALRLGEESAAADRLELDPSAQPERLRVGPLTLSGLHHVIRTHLDTVLPRPTLRRVEQVSGGNPLFALELARALAEAGARPGPGEPLPVPETLSALVERRLARLPASSQAPLVAAAALSHPTREAVCEALGARAATGLDRAVDAQVLESRGEHLRFSHPLLASVVYASASPERRRETHRRLARVTTDPEEQARHLALAASGPDDGVARHLDEAAARASARGAQDVAVELLGLACELTPPGRQDDLARRRLQLAELHFRSGDTETADRVVAELIATHGAGPLRARAFELRARILHVAGASPAAAEACDSALAESGDDVELRARIHATYALVSWHDFALAGEQARTAIELLDELPDPDPSVLGLALLAYAEAEFYLGRGIPTDVVERGLELERSAPAPDVSDRMSAALGAWLKYAGDFDGARHWLEATHRAAIEEGDEGSLPYALSHLPQLELWTGNWAEAERVAREHLELSEATRQPDQRRQALYNLALVHAHMDPDGPGRAEAEELLADSEASGEQWSVANALSLLGFIALAKGDADGAARHLAGYVELRERSGALEPPRSYADYVEALVALGELDRAAEVTALLVDRARVVDWANPRASGARCRGLIAAARGDLDGAIAALDEALAQHERVTVPFELGRTLLALGAVRRRRGERRAARDAFERAAALFEGLGAGTWAERARGEVRRVPIRRGAPDELTPSEERVAVLAAAGRTNREVAKELFISPKTVEANLSRVYRKLGISSRAELGQWLVERPDSSKT